jgi:hypothetical protein
MDVFGEGGLSERIGEYWRVLLLDSRPSATALLTGRRQKALKNFIANKTKVGEVTSRNLGSVLNK